MNTRKVFLWIALIPLILFILLCVLLYSMHEKIIFFHQKLDKQFQFRFNQKYEELNIVSKDNVSLNGVLFKAEHSKGLIFYLHGNAGSLESWGVVASTYTDLNYDVFILDYRGYGKSDGSITGQEQLVQDVQVAYYSMQNRYQEGKIVVLGYSIGTGLAAKTASTNNPKLLILQAPYYSLTDMMRHYYSIMPTFILKYKFETNEYLNNCKIPVVIFHGDQDEVTYYGSSLKLKEMFTNQIKLITLHGEGHNGMTFNHHYTTEIQKILN